MTLNEALTEGLKVTGIGLLIVFSVLAILMVVLMLMEKIFYKKPAQSSNENVLKTKNSAARDEKTATDDSELIAVLAAAVAASLGTPVSDLKIKSYKRVGGLNSAWKKAGLNENLNTGF